MSVPERSKMTTNVNEFLSSGDFRIPAFGLGTWNTSDEETEMGLIAALDAGYRLIDTMYGYSNEVAIGRTLKKMFSSKKLNREDVFVSAKLPTIGNRPEDVELFLRRSLEALQLDYVDMYSFSPVGLLRLEGEPLFPRDENGSILIDPNTDIVEVWKEMEKQVEAGRAKSIGLSFFGRRQVQRILDNCAITPTNIQLELHVYFQNKEMVTFCKNKGITVTAMSPLGAPGFRAYLQSCNYIKRHRSVVKDPVIVDIAEKYNKLPFQVVFRYLLQYGVGVIIKAVTPKRIKQSFDIFDFELTSEEVDRISRLDRGEDGRTVPYSLFPELHAHPEFILSQEF